MHEPERASQRVAHPNSSLPTITEHGALQQSDTFLQTVMDAFPHCVIVVDLEFNVVMANRAARNLAPFGVLDKGCFKCFRFAHHRDTACVGDDEPCPLRKVVRTKAPVRVYHTHRNEAGRCLYMAIDAAPIFDADGDVIQVVESCRDVTERTLWRRILRIGNRHMELQPLLNEFVAELGSYVDCGVVGIRLHDELNSLNAYMQECPCHEMEGGSGASCEDELCICDQILAWRDEGKLQLATNGGSVHISDMREFLSAFSHVFSAVSDEHGRKLCERLQECGCHSLAIVPILFQGRELGTLHLADRQSGAITADVVESLEELSVEMGGVIQRVHIEEELRGARDQLESRVLERTAQLTAINRTLQSEIMERARLEREILQISAREQQRIGQELHDDVGQGLTGLSYLARSLYRRLRDQAHAETEKAEALANGIPEVLGQVRHVVKGLVPVELTAAGIQASLEMLVRSVEQQTGVSCVFNGSLRVALRDDYCALQFYRIAQEAVNNAVRHAKASHIAVQLGGDDNKARITVRDDGVGITGDFEKSPGSGLRIMRYRARAIGGTVEVRRVNTGGTVVICTVENQHRRRDVSRLRGERSSDTTEES